MPRKSPPLPRDLNGTFTVSAAIQAGVPAHPVTTGVSTWVDLAESLALDDLVTAGDWLLRPKSALTADDLRAGLRGGGRGVRRAREALGLIRPGSASVSETLTRLLLVRAGLPEPELNVDLVTESGWVATVDFYWRGWRFAMDYDGRHHRERVKQMDYDLDRARLIRATGIGFEQVTAKHLPGACTRRSSRLCTNS
ncbi:hypothetical protein ACQCX5_11015 [Propionibacteriaceae bacterium G57]|uniref:hypothetical protein n=1 Tax=Aestuariimicrobium sp. G57 TaxID=3418485 RepID=UPI003DA79263